MIKQEVLFTREYKQAISAIFHVNCIKEINCLPNEEIETIAYMTDDYSTNLDSAITKLIFENTKFFLLMDSYIGIFDNRFIVSYDSSTVDFTFLGSSISNWTLEYFGAEKIHCSDFQQYCLNTYGVFITEPKLPDTLLDIIKDLEFNNSLIPTDMEIFIPDLSGISSTPPIDVDYFNNFIKNNVNDYKKQNQNQISHPDILFKKDYHQAIITIFNLESLNITASSLPQEDIDEINIAINDKTDPLESALTKLIFENTKIFLFIDEYIGVFDNRFIVYYDPSIVGFTFIGNSISNWTLNKFGVESVNCSKFQDYCLATYGIPISEAYVPVTFKAIIGDLEFDKSLLPEEEEQELLSNDINHSCDYLSNCSIDELNFDMKAFMEEYRKK